ncbi:MAG TPA: flagellar basal body P-ring protein FlgI [Candidatus Desulfofervidus auxilii]|uniref:Flagellar P-ring protein n=1 Tax=Desulfofervidus auxilii TaxID=1621989 RepID=A0A7C0Y8Z9_DESA2|nr:flagellar basal body P-ring protein FlgI [Candidatus Desulfofervidus auxilii]HDD43991.1 flagellar basal body P-ring protein FlgI [Candidatus Desulfofervidus auxilii]
MKKLFLIILILIPLNVLGARLKDIGYIYGVRENQLIGYGLVVGLAGTGDREQTIFPIQSLVNMLERFGVKVDPKQIRTRNVAAVMVTAEVPPFAKIGMKLDALVSSMGDAKSLEGGVLLMTPLRGPDGNIYAIAQGPISVGGFAARGAGARVRKNFLTVGRVVGGVTIEREIPINFMENGKLYFILNEPDFNTAAQVANVINEELNAYVAEAIDASTVKIVIPNEYLTSPVDLIARLENLTVAPSSIAKVVINERTGTVVIGENVHISTVAVAQGGLSVIIKETPKISQPMPFSAGETVETFETEIEIKEEKTPLYLVPPAATIGELVRALNAIGATPRDLIAILQAIKAAGALHAELEVI